MFQSQFRQEIPEHGRIGHHGILSTEIVLLSQEKFPLGIPVTGIEDDAEEIPAGKNAVGQLGGYIESIVKRGVTVYEKGIAFDSPVFRALHRVTDGNEKKPVSFVFGCEVGIEPDIAMVGILRIIGPRRID
jgi:hypothetical protein